MRFSHFSLCSALVASVLALPSPASHAVHERRDYVPKAWIKGSRLASTDVLPVRIGLTQSNLDKGHEYLMEVSRHDSPKYGQHYTAEEVNEIFAPKQSTVDAVTAWLESAGIERERISQSINKQWIQFDALTEELESILKTEYHVYEHGPTGKHNIACDKYHVPAHVQEHVDYITPGVKLFVTGGKKERNSVERRTFGVTSGKGNAGLLPPLLASLGMTLEALLAIPELQVCSAVITPACIRALYNITLPEYTTPIAGNELGIFEDLNDKYSQTDLSLFWATFSQRIPLNTGPTLKAIDGATSNVPVTSAGPESDLDFQISYPIIYPQKEILFQTDDDVYEANYVFEGFLNNFLDAIDGSYCTFSAYGETGNSPLDPPYPNPAPGGYKGKLQCGVYKPTNVISVSYGGQEADLPASYQKRQCSEFMKLGMQGVSIVISSGDSGVAGPAGDDNANGCLNGTAGVGKVFSPDFPATCPYITALGATYLPTGADVKKDQEVAVTRFPSGGGFSNIYPIPGYQKSAVTNYLTKHTPPYKAYQTADDQNIGANGGIYNSAGRGYPDFSAVGDNVVIFNKGLPTLIGGTSASAPVFAAILTRINEERLRANKKPIGFVNPTLYAHPEVFHDITVGSNPGCGTDGFAVSQGWDPVTGLGTPNYPAMLKLFLSLP